MIHKKILLYVAPSPLVALGTSDLVTNWDLSHFNYFEILLATDTDPYGYCGTYVVPNGYAGYLYGVYKARVGGRVFYFNQSKNNKISCGLGLSYGVYGDINSYNQATTIFLPYRIYGII